MPAGCRSIIPAAGRRNYDQVREEHAANHVRNIASHIIAKPGMPVTR